MNHDVALVAQVLETGEYGEAVRSGASRELLGDRAGIYWDVLSDFYEKHDKVPSVDFFKTLCPDYEHYPTGNPIGALIEELKTTHLGTELNSVLNQIIEANSMDPWEAKRVLVRAADKINAKHQLKNTRTIAGEKGEYVLTTLKRLRDGCGMLGVEWPFSPLNERTPGILPGNVIYLYGRQKSKKTWLMIFMALYFEAMGYRVLFFTREMSIEELHWRIAALLLGLPLDDFNKGNVTDISIDVIRDLMKEYEERGRLIFSDNTEGLPGYKSEIDDVQPDIVMHDYWKAMADDAMGDKYGASEKRYVDRTIDMLVDYHAKIKIPTIICGHANRDGDRTRGRGSSEQAWSDHITRRVHAAIRVVKSTDGNKIGLVVNAGRAIPEDLLFTVDGGLCLGFGEVLDIDSSWVFTSDEAQAASDDSKSRRKKEPEGTSIRDAIKKKGAFKAFSGRRYS